MKLGVTRPLLKISIPFANLFINALTASRSASRTLFRDFISHYYKALWGFRHLIRRMANCYNRHMPTKKKRLANKFERLVIVLIAVNMTTLLLFLLRSAE